MRPPLTIVFTPALAAPQGCRAGLGRRDVAEMAAAPSSRCSESRPPASTMAMVTAHWFSGLRLRQRRDNFLDVGQFKFKVVFMRYAALWAVVRWPVGLGDGTERIARGHIRHWFAGKES